MTNNINAVNFKLTVEDAEGRLESAKKDLAKQDDAIKKAVSRLTAAMKKNDFEEVKHCNNLITRGFENKERYEAWVQEAEFRLESSKMEETPFAPIVDFLYHALNKDMKWWSELAELKVNDYAEFKELHKSSQAIGLMTENEALKFFRHELTVRFQKLVMKIADKVGNVKSCELSTNYNQSFDGTVVGDKGTVTMVTIMVEGPIQRFHYRTLIK